MNTSAIALLSGGLDSIVATALAQRSRDVRIALTFDYGQRAVVQELAVARLFCEASGIEHRAIELPWLHAWTQTALVDREAALPTATPATLDEGALERARAVWVPNRNGVFVAIAAAMAESLGAQEIVAGFNAEEAETFPDNTSAFVDATNAVLRLATLAKVRLVAPALTMSKAEIARIFLALNIAPETFWCCYEGGELLCGRCESCARTIRAFTVVGALETIRRRFTVLPLTTERA
jgi:7-cyano-7-deazaguanine synthase